MRRLRLAVIVLAGLWLVGELAAAPLAERRIEQEVAARSRESAGVRADVDSFPLASRVLVTGRVRQLTITLEDVADQDLTFTEIRFELEGIEVDRPAMLNRDVRITAIDRGTVTAAVDLGALSRIAGRALAAVGDEVRVQAGTLVVGPVSFRLPSELLPCDLDVRVEGERVIMSCTIDDIPPELLRRMQGG